MKNLINYFINIYKQRFVIAYMAKIELSVKYAGTYIGILWAIINPVVTVLIYWLVFSQGLKISTPSEAPYIVYFVTGLIPWLIFSEVLNTSINGVRGNLHLIKKTNYPSEILPVVFLLSSIITHFIFILILLIILIFNNISFNVSIFTVIYYFILLCILVTGLSWIFSALNVLFKDTSHIIPVVLNFWFWLTPIIWNKEIVPDKYSWILNLNPLVYIVDGYRNAFIFHRTVDVMSYESLINTACYLIVFILGALVFDKLKYEFADAI